MRYRPPEFNASNPEQIDTQAISFGGIQRRNGFAVSLVALMGVLLILVGVVAILIGFRGESFWHDSSLTGRRSFGQIGIDSLESSKVSILENSDRRLRDVEREQLSAASGLGSEERQQINDDIARKQADRKEEIRIAKERYDVYVQQQIDDKAARQSRADDLVARQLVVGFACLILGALFCFINIVMKRLRN